MDKEKKVYDEILEILHKNKEILIFNFDSLEREARVHLFGLELKEIYGLNINPKQVDSTDYQSFGDKKIGLFGKRYNREIAWSVDGRQPDDEYLFTLGFPTGAFMFGEDYPTIFFQKFWLELKEYKPDYVDENNHCLYWKLKNAKAPFNDYDSLLKKYYEFNKEDIRRRKIEKMKAEIELLENENG